jgi:ubiquinone/menaquinone biosynthesis C-methylase UbiE
MRAEPNELFHNRDYYDQFSQRYDTPRSRGYHWMIDTLQTEVVQPLAEGRDVLEVGCGTGLLMERLRGRCVSLTGLDISPGMAARARKRGHHVTVGSADSLPFEDESFDLVYSFKVLAHIEPIEKALAEISRVLRPGGHFVGDFYNPWSIRGLIKALKPPTAIADGAHDEHVFTRFDSPRQVVSHLPPDLPLVRFRGVRVVTPFAGVFALPGAETVWTRIERMAGRSPLWRFGGFLVAVCRKRG